MHECTFHVVRNVYFNRETFYIFSTNINVIYRFLEVQRIIKIKSNDYITIRRPHTKHTSARVIYISVKGI